MAVCRGGPPATATVGGPCHVRTLRCWSGPCAESPALASRQRALTRTGPDARSGGPHGCAAGQQMLSVAFGFVRPNSGRSRSPTQVPARAAAPQTQPEALPDAMPAR